MPSSSSSQRPRKPNQSPPWEALLLLGRHLDPKTLAASACVSKSWNAAMSSDHLWRPICLSHFPSSLLLTAADPTLPPRRLFSILHASSNRRRRRPSPPRIALRHLILTVDVSAGGAPVLSLMVDGEEIDHSGVFRFDVDVGEAAVEVVEELRATWRVVMKGWGGAFAMMDCEGKGRVIGGSVLWFSEELPGPACCSAGGGGLVAELGLEFGEGESRGKVRRVSMGLLSVVGCRYVGVDNALLYLEPFLLHS